MAFFWVSSIFCHRSSFLFSTDPNSIFLISSLLLVSFAINILTLLVICLMAYRRHRHNQSLRAEELMEKKPCAGGNESDNPVHHEVENNPDDLTQEEPCDNRSKPDDCMEILMEIETPNSKTSPETPDEQEKPSTEDMLEHIFDTKAEEIAGIFGLTNRETEVLFYLLQGRSAGYIADVLYISENTVRSHIRHILEKTNTESKQQLIGLMLR
ncbi:MAG: helix-turn-helix transcriptional regulator [Coriobacteriales bacterium]|nr:helix-turn-helix transcriptional regulator [Coriobacteriales bacterium]